MTHTHIRGIDNLRQTASEPDYKGRDRDQFIRSGLLNPIRKDISYPFLFPLPATFLYLWRKWERLLEVIYEPW